MSMVMVMVFVGLSCGLNILELWISSAVLVGYNAKKKSFIVMIKDF